MNTDKLVRANIKALKPYESARGLVNEGAFVFMDANENPYGDGLNRYPDPYQQKVKEKLGALKGIQPQHIFLGNGSDEIIDLLIRSFAVPGQDNIVVHEPGFSMYEVAAQTNDVEVRRFLLNGAFQPEMQAIAEQVDGHTKLVFFCTPNNPTGNSLDRDVILGFAESFSGLVVVDEAYVDFSTAGSLGCMADKLPNVVVLQTFSKAWGLAGARLGMGYMHESLIGVLNKVKHPYNVNKLTMQAALERLAAVEGVEGRIRQLVQERERLAQTLSGCSFVEKVFPSDANFLLVRFADAQAVQKHLYTQGIIVRNRSSLPGCENSIRISVGTPEENKKLIHALNNLKII